MMRILTALALGMMLAPGLANARPKQVIFENEMRQQEGAAAFYMDRAGDLYPPAAVKLDTLYLINVRSGERPTVSTSSTDFATLKSLYRWKSSRPQDTDWPALLAHTGVVASGDFDRDWASVQIALRGEAAQMITALGKSNDDVVLLIHGYNNDHGEAKTWYAHVEGKLRNEAGTHDRRIAFVRMYWDGLAGKTPLFIWDNAQYNGFLVGLELRRLLQQVDGATPLRVFTHSSGAYVIANALGDGSAAAQLSRLPKHYPSLAAGQEGYAPPMQLRDLRVAMLVPAQPTTAFAHYFRNAGGDGIDGSKKAAVPQRLILGLSKRDFATNKAGIIPCHWKGATCMAVEIDESCRQVAKDLGIQPPQLMAVNFARQGLVHGHGVDRYTDDAEWPELTRALLAPDPGMPVGTRTLCPAPATVAAD